MQRISKKHLTLGVIGFVVLVGAGWYEFMRYSLNRMEKEIATLEGNLKKQDFEISHKPIKFTHTPFSLKATIPDLHLKTPEGAVTWKSSTIHITLYPWAPKIITFDIPTPQHLLFAKTTLVPIRQLTLNKTHGTLDLTSSNNPGTLSMKVDHVMSMAEGKAQALSLKDLSLTLAHLSTPLMISIEASSHITGLETLLQLSSTSKPLTLSLKAALSGFQGPIPGPHSLAEWRDGGGVLDISTLTFTWEPLEVMAEGTITVDKDLYPLGSFSSHIKGYDEGLSQLTKAGLIKEQNATMAAFFLNMLSQSNEKGDKTIKVPLTIQDRHLSLGSIPLITLKTTPPLQQTLPPHRH